jgi:hypothetical protein
MPSGGERRAEELAQALDAFALGWSGEALVRKCARVCSTLHVGIMRRLSDAGAGAATPAATAPATTIPAAAAPAATTPTAATPAAATPAATTTTPTAATPAAASMGHMLFHLLLEQQLWRLKCHSAAVVVGHEICWPIEGRKANGRRDGFARNTSKVEVFKCIPLDQAAIAIQSPPLFVIGG